MNLSPFPVDGIQQKTSTSCLSTIAVKCAINLGDVDDITWNIPITVKKHV